MKRFVSTGILLIILIGAYFTGHMPNQLKDLLPQDNHQTNQISNEKSSSYDKVIQFPSKKYPETAKHIKDAIDKGKSKVCTIDRNGAETNREQSLKNVPTKKGYDRDEWPMAFCKEGGTGADIEYINPSDNRGAGSWVSHQVHDIPNGTRLLFVVR